MNKVILFTWIGCILTFGVHAQVKIGDNPSTINSNSLLEMESTNKGLLMPRMAINSLDLATPLSGTVPAGMMVYSVGGLVPDGLYSWNGNKWSLYQTSSLVRTNMVLLRTEADFPTPVSGVITLVSGVLYEVNGTVTMTNKINLNGCALRGIDRDNDKLIYTPTSGELFTGANGGHIYNLTLSATGIGAKLFNLDAAGDQSKVLVCEFDYIFNNDNIGTIKNFPGFIVFNNCAYSNNTNGITLQDLGDYIALNDFWIADNHNTYHKLVGSFNTILISGGKMHTLAYYTAKAIDVSGITSITTGAELKNSLFVGDGTPIVGSFSKQWEVESNGLDTEKDDVASGNIYISSSTTTTFSAASTPTKILGTTTAASLFRVTSPMNNRMNYNGTKKRRFSAICSLSLVASGSNKSFSFYFAKNGVVLPESKQTLKLGSSADKGSLTLSCTIPMSPNDYIEVWMENITDATSATIETLNLAIK